MKMLQNDIKKRFSGRKLLKSFSKFLSITEELPETVVDILDEFKKGKIQIIVSDEVPEKKNNHFGLKIIMIILLSVSISFLIGIRGNLDILKTGLELDVMLTSALMFPIVLTFIYFLTRQKLNL